MSTHYVIMSTDSAIPPSELRFYHRTAAPLLYDLVSHAVFAPAGGLRRLRSQALEAMAIEPGMRVLELGCGSGGLTRMLVERGAAVTSVDHSRAMIARAHARAPGATFVESDLARFEPAARYDRVIWALVLHELSRDARRRTLARGVAALAPGGRAFALEHAFPESGAYRRVYGLFIGSLDREVRENVLGPGFDRELGAIGLVRVEARDLADGTARLSEIAPR
jgi:SAM-dependent methyltransferase